jgi:hypothetical protein
MTCLKYDWMAPQCMFPEKQRHTSRGSPLSEKYELIEAERATGSGQDGGRFFPPGRRRAAGNRVNESNFGY